MEKHTLQNKRAGAIPSVTTHMPGDAQEREAQEQRQQTDIAIRTQQAEARRLADQALRDGQRKFGGTGTW